MRKDQERDAGDRFAPRPLHLGRIMLVTMLVAAPNALASVARPEMGSEIPTVLPDRIEDISLIRADADSFPILDNFSWRAFIALNWPSLPDAAHRGLPDRARTIGDAGPRVWETFKARYELFQTDSAGNPQASSPWASYDAVTPCGSGIDAREKTLATFNAFRDFNQPVFLPGLTATPLVAQNRTYTRYETRLNRIEYEALERNGWSSGKDMPDESRPLRLPAGSIAVKAAWRVLTRADTPAVRARYYVVTGTNLVDTARTISAGHVVCTKGDVALVGLHIVIRTPHRPQGIWASFEHVDNVPPTGTGDAREPDAADAGAPYSYFDASRRSRGAGHELEMHGLAPVSMAQPPRLDPEPTQVVRRLPIHASTMAINRRHWAAPGIKGTVWEHYMLVATQWPTFTKPVDPSNDGIFFPDRRRENMANTTMETFVQDSPVSCMSCHHAVSNARGRDFVAMLETVR